MREFALWSLPEHLDGRCLYSRAIRVNISSAFSLTTHKSPAARGCDKRCTFRSSLKWAVTRRRMTKTNVQSGGLPREWTFVNSLAGTAFWTIYFVLTPWSDWHQSWAMTDISASPCMQHHRIEINRAVVQMITSSTDFHRSLLFVSNSTGRSQPQCDL